MDIEAISITNKQELREYLQEFNNKEFELIQKKLLSENSSKEFAEELNYNFFENDEKTIVYNKYVSTEYRNASDRFFDEYYSGIAMFFVIKATLYVSFNIPGIKENVYEVEITTIDTPIDDAYIEFNLREVEGVKFDLLNNKITVEE